MSDAWKPWWDNVKAGDANAAQGGIFAANGAVCYSDADVSGPDVIKSATSYSSLTIGGQKFMRLSDNDECVNLRGSGRPALIYKTGNSFILVVGAEGTDAGSFAANICNHMKSDIFYDADSETFKI